MENHSNRLSSHLILLGVAFLTLLSLKWNLGEVLFPAAQMRYPIHTDRRSQDFRVDVSIQVTSGSELLLTGRDEWALRVEVEDPMHAEDPTQEIYYYNIPKQVVYTSDIDENGTVRRTEVSPDVVKGVTLHKDGIVLTSKEKRVFTRLAGEDEELTFQNISKAPLTFTVKDVLIWMYEDV